MCYSRLKKNSLQFSSTKEPPWILMNALAPAQPVLIRCDSKSCLPISSLSKSCHSGRHQAGLLYGAVLSPVKGS